MHRAPPENANAARGEGGVARKAIRSKNEQGKDSLAFTAIQCWQDVHCLTDRLNIVADYEQQLLVRIRWAQLKMELGMDVAEFDGLLAESEDFKSVCAALGRRRAA